MGEVRLGVYAQSLGLLLRLAQLAVFRDFYARFGEAGVRAGEISVLGLIHENPGVRQGRLAERLMIKRAHMTKIVQGMEAEGLVERAVPEGDKRAVTLRLTEAGAARVAAWRAPILEHEAATAARLTAEEVETLRALLRKYLGLDAEGLAG